MTPPSLCCSKTGISVCIVDPEAKTPSPPAFFPFAFFLNCCPHTYFTHWKLVCHFSKTCFSIWSVGLEAKTLPLFVFFSLCILVQHLSLHILHSFRLACDGSSNRIIYLPLSPVSDNLNDPFLCVHILGTKTQVHFTSIGPMNLYPRPFSLDDAKSHYRLSCTDLFSSYTCPSSHKDFPPRPREYI